MPSGSKIAKYKGLLIDLLPKGRLWDLINMPKFDGLVGALAVEFARVEDRVLDMLKEADPRNANELLEDWERMLGLPDECTPPNPTFEARVGQVVQKYTSVGGISAQYYAFLIAQLGFPTNRVFKWHQFRVGHSTVGDPLTNDFDEPFTVGMTVGHSLRDTGWLFYFNVEVPLVEDVFFEVGRSVVGESLREYGNELVECTIKKLKPAHAGVTFTFTG